MPIIVLLLSLLAAFVLGHFITRWALKMLRKGRTINEDLLKKLGVEPEERIGPKSSTLGFIERPIFFFLTIITNDFDVVVIAIIAWISCKMLVGWKYVYNEIKELIGKKEADPGKRWFYVDMLRMFARTSLFGQVISIATGVICALICKHLTALM